MPNEGTLQGLGPEMNDVQDMSANQAEGRALNDTCNGPLGSAISGATETCAKEYRPNRGELLRSYNISIQFLSIGCMVTVGCKSIPFTSVEEAMKEIAEYVANPFDASKKWANIFEEYK